MQYHGAVIRPPSEADSLIVQVTYGCSHGECDFCATYLDKPFRVRPFAEVVQDVTGLPDGSSAGCGASSWPMATRSSFPGGACARY